MRKKLAAVALYTAVTALACEAFAPDEQWFDRYTALDLTATLADAGILQPTIVGIDDSGYVVGHRLVDGVQAGFRWNGDISELDCVPKAVNAAGQIGCLKPENIPAVLEAGVLTPLLPAGKTGSVEYIGDGGHVLGATTTASGASTLYRWHDGELEYFQFHYLTGRPNRFGDTPFKPLVGLYNTARVWMADGTAEDIGAWGRYSTATAINDDGVVVGTSERMPGSRAFVWRKTSALDSIGPTTWSGASQINNGGLVIAGDGATHFLWRDGRHEAIEALLDTPEWKIVTVIRLTDDGRMFIRGEHQGSSVFGLLTPRR